MTAWRRLTARSGGPESETVWCCPRRHRAARSLAVIIDVASRTSEGRREWSQVVALRVTLKRSVCRQAHLGAHLPIHRPRSAHQRRGYNRRPSHGLVRELVAGHRPPSRHRCCTRGTAPARRAGLAVRPSGRPGRRSARRGAREAGSPRGAPVPVAARCRRPAAAGDPRRGVAAPRGRVDTMIAGVSGNMLSSGFLARRVQEEQHDVAPEFDRWVRATVRWWHHARQVLGPASPPRLVLDVGARPLLELLGYSVAHVEPQSWGHAAILGAGGAPVAALLNTGWGAPPSGAWRQALRSSLAVRLPWALVFSGDALTVVDGARPWTRRQLSFDLGLVCRDRLAMLALWTLAHADALHARSSPSRLARGAVGVGCARRDGVFGARRGRARRSRRTGLGPRCARYQAPARSTPGASRLRTVAHYRLPPAVPAVCRGAPAGADVAPRLSRLRTASVRYASG